MTEELPIGRRQVRITHADRVVFPKANLTKLDLALYYARVGDWLLPELLRRPVTVIRCPRARRPSSANFNNPAIPAALAGSTNTPSRPASSLYAERI